MGKNEMGLVSYKHTTMQTPVKPPTAASPKLSSAGFDSQSFAGFGSQSSAANAFKGPAFTFDQRKQPSMMEDTTFYPHNAMEICKKFESVLNLNITIEDLNNDPEMFKKVCEVAEQQAHKYGGSPHALIFAVCNGITNCKPEVPLRLAIYRAIVAPKRATIESKMEEIMKLISSKDSLMSAFIIIEAMKNDPLGCSIVTAWLTRTTINPEYWNKICQVIFLDESKKHERDGIENMPLSKTQATTTK